MFHRHSWIARKRIPTGGRPSFACVRITHELSRRRETSLRVTCIQSLFVLGNSPCRILLKWDFDPEPIELALYASANNPARVPLLAGSRFQRRSDFYTVVAERFDAEYLRFAE